MSALQAFQTSFGHRIRGGARAPLPAGVPRRRMAVYEELLFNNLRGFVDRCFPVARACLGEARWTRLCRAFFRDWPCRSSWFREIPREFVDYLESTCRQPLPRWFVELARYEWAELAVDVTDVRPPDCDATGDLLDGVPVVNPALLSLGFQWPVHKIPQAPAAEVMQQEGQPGGAPQQQPAFAKHDYRQGHEQAACQHPLHVFEAAVGRGLERCLARRGGGRRHEGGQAGEGCTIIPAALAANYLRSACKKRPACHD